MSFFAIAHFPNERTIIVQAYNMLPHGVSRVVLRSSNLKISGRGPRSDPG